MEEFPKDNRTSSDLVTMIYRDELTSVTFKCSTYQGKSMGHWAVDHWNRRLEELRWANSRALLERETATDVLRLRCSDRLCRAHSSILPA